MSGIIIFDYEGQDISFEFVDGNKMVNVIQMAKFFKGKMVVDFFCLKQIKEYIFVLEFCYGDFYNGRNKEVLRVVQGGILEF